MVRDEHLRDKVTFKEIPLTPGWDIERCRLANMSQKSAKAKSVGTLSFWLRVKGPRREKLGTEAFMPPSQLSGGLSGDLSSCRKEGTGEATEGQLKRFFLSSNELL